MDAARPLMLSGTNMVNIFRLEALHPQYNRFVFVMNYSYMLGLIVHLGFIPLFFKLGIPVLAYVNGLSIVIYAVAILLNARQKLFFSTSLVTLELLGHAALVVYFIGWDSGFFIYVLALIPLLFYMPLLNNPARAAGFFGISLFYIGLRYYTDTHAPVVQLEQTVLNVLYYGNSMVFMLTLAFLSFYFSKATHISEAKLQDSYARIDRLARTDPMTRLSNRRDMNDRLQEVAQVARITGNPFVIIIADIDNFKYFNDAFGHDCGDFIICSIARELRKRVRHSDSVGRWGGEEFMIVMQDTGLDDASVLIESIRAAISEKDYSYKGRSHRVTLTFGLSECKSREDIQPGIIAADTALYRGKREGKNRLVIHGLNGMVDDEAV